MKKFTLNPVVLWNRHISKKPWFVLNTDGVADKEGFVKVDMDWNRAFIDNLVEMGISGHNEEEIVENYLTLVAGKQASEDPYMPAGHNEPFSEAHPALSSDQNRLMQ